MTLKMLQKLGTTLLFLFTSILQAQTTIIPNKNDSRSIVTGLPFNNIAPDARSAAMGDMGVATSVDAFSQQWNASKYVFSEDQQGFSLSYTPYLKKLVNDIGIGYLTYFNRINERSAVGASFKYFGLGEVTFRKGPEEQGTVQKPNEFKLDVSYSLRLNDRFAMAVEAGFVRSDLRLNYDNNAADAASTFGVGISGYYQSEETAYTTFNGRWRAGFALQNIGPKFKYDDDGADNFQPTNLRLGGGFDFIFDDYNKLSVTAEVTKLLVPTPPILGDEYNFTDNNNNGVYDEAVDDIESTPIREDIIYKGKSEDVGFLAGMFQSFGDAPGGFSEELKEFTYALGAEYMYQDAFAFRAGYFNESEEKGARKFLSLGAGFKYNTINIDFSYLFSASKIQNPLENTLRFSVTLNLGAGAYSEY